MSFDKIRRFSCVIVTKKIFCSRYINRTTTAANVQNAAWGGFAVSYMEAIEEKSCDSISTTEAAIVTDNSMNTNRTVFFQAFFRKSFNNSLICMSIHSFLSSSLTERNKNKTTAVTSSSPPEIITTYADPIPTLTSRPSAMPSATIPDNP